MSELGKVCSHGSLERQCRTCELEAECDRLKAELEARILFEDQESIRHKDCFKSESGGTSFVDKLEKDRDRWRKRAEGLAKAGNALWNVDQTEEVSKAWREALAAYAEEVKDKMNADFIGKKSAGLN